MNEMEALSTFIMFLTWIAAGVAWGFAASALTNLAIVSDWHITPRIIRVWRSNRKWRQFCETHDLTHLNECAARFGKALRQMNDELPTAEEAARAMSRICPDIDATLSEPEAP